MKRLLCLALVGVAACSLPPEDEPTAWQSLAAGGTLDGTVLGNGLRVRPTPDRSQAEIATLSDGQVVTISCQTSGENIEGSSVWDFLPAYNGYVSDNHVLTGRDGFHPDLPRCGTSGGGNGSTPKPDTGSSSALVTEARKHLGKTESAGNCNEFSRYFGRSGGCQEWCSDFVNYVWMLGGYKTDGITGYSGTIADYGRRYGTFKAGRNADAKVGDAVLWGYGSQWTPDVPSKHVGLVTEVYGDGRIKVIHGNFGPPPDSVKEGVITRDSDVGTGYGIYGFVSPAR